MSTLIKIGCLLEYYCQLDELIFLVINYFVIQENPYFLAAKFYRYACQNKIPDNNDTTFTLIRLVNSMTYQHLLCHIMSNICHCTKKTQVEKM